jgi:hypothetical protein
MTSLRLRLLSFSGGDILPLLSRSDSAFLGGILVEPPQYGWSESGDGGMDDGELEAANDIDMEH